MKTLSTMTILCLMILTSQAQQYPDRHSTSQTDAWLSCTPTTSPNLERGEGHWINYNLGATYVLDQIELWNYNVPTQLQNGVNEIAIDVSADGINWTEAATATIEIANGSSFYEGVYAVNLGGVSADYVLITAISNHGGTCTGFAEVKMSAAVVLPIELSKFDARCVQGNEGVEIAWRSDTEVNNDYYIIQRSTNAIDWEDVEIVPSKGANGQGANYYALDKNVSGSLYYRLVNVDLDGQRQHFDAVAVNCIDDEVLSMSVSNPFTESLSLTYNPWNDSPLIVTVETLDGRQVYQRSHQANDAQFISLATAAWTAGAYVLTIDQGSKRISQQIIKM